MPDTRERSAAAFELCDPRSRFSSRHFCVDAFQPVYPLDCRGVARRFSVQLVAGTDGNFVEFVQNVELGHHQPGHAVVILSSAVADVHPPAARGRGHRTEFVAALAQQVTMPVSSDGTDRHRRECNSLGDADDGVDRCRWNPVPIVARRRSRWTT